MRKPIRFTSAEAEAASDEWGFNCGPGALCAALGMTPPELRPHLLDFEAKRYTNPTLMTCVLKGLGAAFEQTSRSDEPRVTSCLPFGKGISLVRVQWAGPWTKAGVPMRVRYRKTHWIAVDASDGMVFDINALNDAVKCDGWVSYFVWVKQLVPWLLKAAQITDATGEWWPTHILQLEARHEA